MTPVLAVDTAGPVIGVAVWDGERAWERVVRIGKGTEERLPGLVEEVCGSAGVPLGALRGVGAAVGPGAFTGLRVGLAFAGGLASALHVPVWPVGSLVPRAAHAAPAAPLLVMLDARKGRVYAGCWSEGRLTRGPADVAPDEALTWVSGPFAATGEGALVYRALVEAAGGALCAEADHPGTGALARLASAGLLRGEGVAPNALRTDYLREPDAVLKSGVGTTG